MTSGDEERLRSWVFEVIEAILEGVTWRQEGNERRAVGQGGLSVNIKSGAWFIHSLGRGGWSVVPLIERLKVCIQGEAITWADAWLSSHPGLGSIANADDDADDDAGSARAAYAKELIERAVDPAGTPAEIYLRARSIAVPLPSCVKYIPDARVGEGALAGILTARGRVVGVQVLYVDPTGRRSTIPPSRRRFMLEKAPDAVLEVQATPAGVTDLNFDTWLAEGLEDGLSLAMLGRPVCIRAIPGIGGLRHISVRKGERLLVAADGDDPDSPASEALTIGIDALLLQGAVVRVVEVARGDDANAVLQRDGVSGLARWLSDTNPAALSQAGEFERLSRLSPVEYDGERKRAAEFLGIRVSTLDSEIARIRGAKTAAASQAAASADGDDIELLDDPVDLAETLDAIMVELARYIVADESSLVTVTLWCGHCHLCHHETIRLRRSPRLAIQARTPASGKTTLLEAIGALVPRPRLASSLTAATVLRAIDLVRPSLLIDEADRILRDRASDLLAILNAGDRRVSAWVERAVPTPDGGWEVQRFSVWGPIALAGIDELPPTQQDRSLVIQMEKALGSDIQEHLTDGDSPALAMLKRQLATWAHNLEELPWPKMPDLLERAAGRAGDNWRVLFAIAALAGGRWPGLVETAALAAVRREGQMTVVQRLLESVWRIFDKRAVDARVQQGDDKTRIPTPDLIAALLADDEEEWGTVNRGRAVTDYWLRGALRHLLDPPGSVQWAGPMRGTQRGRRYRGYYKAQFEKAWARHLPSSVYPHEPSEASGVSGKDEGYQGDDHDKPSGVADDIRGNGAAPDDGPTPDEDSYPTKENSKNSTTSTTSPDAPDAPDTLDGKAKEEEGEGGAGASPPDIDRDIIAFSAANPKKSVASIARKFGQPAAVIRQLLGRDK